MNWKTRKKREEFRIRVPEEISEAIKELLNGKMLEVEDGGTSKMIQNRLSSLKDDGYLKTAYDTRNKTSYIWLEERPEAFHERWGSTIWDILFAKK